jgi:RsiW-degrading membrane proteinase PrsW (M82 family)
VLDLIISATIPPLLVLYFIYRNDLYEAEPHDLLFKTFFLGCVIVIPIYLIETYTSILSENTFIYTLVGIALVEEGVKYITLLYYNFPKKSFNEPYDGIIYSVVLTMGFALVENIGYVIKDDTGATAIFRMLTAIPLHATAGIIMGYFLGKSKMESNNKTKNLILALLIPTLIHGVYDYFAFTNNVLLFVIVIFGVVYSLKAIKIHQQNSPFK